MHLTIEFIKQGLLEPLPGKAAQYKMAPEGRDITINTSKTIQKAGVLLLLFPVNGCLHTAFIKRASEKGPHSGQISLPGGKHETFDFDITLTALRETYEEVGVKVGVDEIIGKLTPLHIPISGFEVHPFVAYVNEQPEFKADSNEVEYILSCSVEQLMHKDNLQSEVWNLHNKRVKVPFYNIKNEKIWGATAMIISEFIEVIKRIN